MEHYLYLVIITIAVLAIIDLMVGVSNDAVNFLNSGLGSKALSFRLIMILASAGILCGALFSSGMMEIARSGIYVPSMFSFNDVMVIFLAVMITDIILLDVFNYFGLPTSTTVSIVFELLGAAVCLALYKIYTTTGEWSTLPEYINTDKATEIVVSILLSVVISFTLGMLVQYVSRVIFTFQFEKRLKTFGVLFGGLALALISYFILIKGLKSVTFISSDVKLWITTHELLILAGSFVFFTILSFILTRLNVNILKVIVGVGTFGLALSFAGNDLVNFIGVPVAAIQSIGFFKAAGGDPNTYMMSELASSNIVAPMWILTVSGLIMLFTLWTSKKARTVIETEMNLSSQDSSSEKFQPNTLSRWIVRGFVNLGNILSYVMPRTLQTKLDKRFEQASTSTKQKSDDEPMFDMVRASVNLMVASSLIALGTSMKLPLSTTYVTFMVAMGSAFADRAWDRESAVYRVSGVFHVIGGWFFTAACAFTGAFIIAYFLKIGGIVSFVVALIVLALLLFQNARSHRRKVAEQAERKLQLEKSDIRSLQQVTEASANQISEVIAKSNLFYKEVVDNLIKTDLTNLAKNKKLIKKLNKDIDSNNDNLFNFIRNLDDTSAKSSRYYIMALGYLQDIVENLYIISNNALNHVDNNHKPLRESRGKDLQIISDQLGLWYSEIYTMYKRLEFSNIEQVMKQRDPIQKTINILLDKQITDIRTSDSSPKNTKLYFSILLETNEMISSTFKLLRLHSEFLVFKQANNK
ncbi:phosphate transporter family protein [Sphingobacterium alimentarium]|uniref:Phosphate transporter n=1 Tax=Sphingobacterium alimentarium TaxID=797292 RepID=A0A4R3W0W1_9SPHI|nr:inorganic phosphate transporter [Sphingobacterium alimentarium]TCV19290.1 phosphate transporter family protein [Sphingobacterium alimentarium]